MTDPEEQRLKEECLNYASDHPYQHSILVGLSCGALTATFTMIVFTLMTLFAWFIYVDLSTYVNILIKCLILSAILWGLVCVFPFTHKQIRWWAHGRTRPKNCISMILMGGLFIVTVIWTIWLWRYIDTQIQL